MNVVRLMDGLGNQMYQYAFGQALAFMESEVCYDVSWFTKGARRTYGLDKFNANIKLHTFQEDKPTLSPGRFPDIERIDDTNFTGFWQERKYYVHILSDLRKQLLVKKEFYTPEFIALRKKISSSNSVSIHVRRGDIAKVMPYCILPMEYYTEALDRLRAVRKVDHVYIFSDDIA